MGFAEVLGEVEKSMGILSGLKNLGLGNLENMDVFEGQKKQEAKKPEPVVAQKPQEKDLIYERSFTCPVCDTSFTSKVMKSNKARLLGTDQDLRPRYDGIDASKYEVVMCPVCGCAALMRYFTTITSAQAKLIRDNICQVLKMKPYQGETYTYEHALERYQLALAEAVVKRSKTSERAYICLKYAWLVRGYAEDLKGRENPDEKQLAELAAQEGELLQNAYKGFTEARQTEMFPLCGMNEITVDYLLSVLAVRFKDYQVAVKLLGSIITSTSANARIKDRARDMKEQVVKELKKMQG
nr:DUF2225 domain-containing protein [uncultured Acetatifactor sp.]